MNTNHCLLACFWLLYCSLHSIFAATTFKSLFAQNFKNAYRYYRLVYSVFASISLIALLYYQYSFTSLFLLHSHVIKYFSLLILVLPGVLIMIISIVKYFLLLSGVQSIYQKVQSVELKKEGIHKYVRHPLYFGTLCFTWGLFFIFPMLSNLIAMFFITIYVVVGIRFEEKKLLKQFGNSYRNYKLQVPMLIPGLPKLKKAVIKTALIAI